MRLIFILFSCVLAVLSCTANENKICHAYHLESEPAMDGQIDKSSVWNKIPYISGFAKIGSGETSPAKKETSFKLGYTENTLYLLVKCDDSEISEILDSHKDKESVFADDSIEIFISPEAGGRYFQFATNPAGSRWNTPPVLWDWKVKAFKKKDCWILEIKIPFEIFKIMPDGGDSWSFNICRNIQSKSGRFSSSWSPVKNSFHEQRNWGRLIFEK